MRVLITGGRTPFALHLTRLFHTAGHQVLVTDSPRHALASFTTMKQGFVRTADARFHTAQYEADIERILESWGPELVVPSCEEIFYLTRLFARLGRSDMLFAAPFELLALVHSKASFASLATELGAGAGENIVLRSRADVEAFTGDPAGFVFKPVWSRFASRVLISPERSALASIDPTPENPWLAQTRIRGKEYCVYAVARHGQLVAVSAYHNLLRAGAGTGVVYERVEAPDIEAFLERFVAHTGWHGQVSFDLIRTPEGRLVAIECNPRATSGLSLFLPEDGLVEAMLTGSRARRPSRFRLAIKGTAFLVGILGWAGVVPRQPWLRLLMSSGDALSFPGESSLLWGQTLASQEVFQLAKEKNIPVLEATTYDMEWNGEADPLRAPTTSEPAAGLGS